MSEFALFFNGIFVHQSGLVNRGTLASASGLGRHRGCLSGGADDGDRRGGLGGLLGGRRGGSLNLDRGGNLLGGLGSLLLGNGSDSLLGLLLLVGLDRLLALDSITELGERRGRLGLLGLVIRGGLLLGGEKGADEGERALALVALHLLLGLPVGGGSDLDRLGGDSGGRRDIGGEGLGRLDGGDDGGSLSDGLGGRGRLSDGSGLGRGNLLLAERQVGEQALALDDGGLGLGNLLLLLLGLGGLGGLDGGSSLDGSSGDLSGSNLGGDSRGLGGSSSLGLSSGLDLLLLLLTEDTAKDGGALAASRAALGLLDSELVLLGLLLLGRLSGSSLGGGDGRGFLDSGSRGGSSLDDGLDGLLLLPGGLEGLEGLLVGLRLGDGNSKSLGLLNLGLQLGNPRITLGGGRSLEGVLVALGGEEELVGALGAGLRSLGLERWC